MVAGKGGVVHALSCMREDSAEGCLCRCSNTECWPMRIEPSVYDVVVISSGLVEGLLASALVKAGRSVLLLDQSDVYGSACASFTLAGLQGSSDPAQNPNLAQQCAKGKAEATDHDLFGASFRLLPVNPPTLPIQPATLVQDQLSSSIGPARSYILDLATRMMYQAEELVDVLLATKAHNYVEFKAVEASYILQDGKLRPVPASRADIFKDKGLSLKDKRNLMTFLATCMEAVDGKGPLADKLADSAQSLASVLESQGLSPSLRDMVLYGIAMADWCQEAGAAEGSAAQHTISAPQGAAAFTLLGSSQGRFGSPGALMVPTYGCGSLPEALARHVAVHGAVTALRQAVEALVLGPKDQPIPGVYGTTGQQQEQQQQHDAGTAMSAQVVRGVRLASGQVIECRHALVMSSSSLAGTETAAESASRALVIMDRPLRASEGQAMLVIPPGTPGVENMHPVRGMQLGPGTYVAPPGRYLLYLSTPASGASAQQDLEKAVAQLVHLPSPVSGSADDAVSSGQAGAAGAEGESTAASGVSTQGSNTPQALQVFYYRQRFGSAPPHSAASSCGEDSMPGSAQPSTRPSTSIPNLILCPGPSSQLVGYGDIVAHAKSLLSEHFPGIPWLLDPQPRGDAHEAGDVAGGGDVDVEEAVLDLQAALAGLQQGLTHTASGADGQAREQ